MLSSCLGCRGPRLNSTRPSVVSNPSGVDIVSYRPIVNIMYVGNVYVVDRAIVVKIAAVPISAVVTIARVPPSIVNAAIKAYGRSPISRVPQVESSRKAPPARRPQEAHLRRVHPSSRHPVVVAHIRVPSPVPGRPQVARPGT